MLVWEQRVGKWLSVVCIVCQPSHACQCAVTSLSERSVGVWCGRLTSDEMGR